MESQRSYTDKLTWTANMKKVAVGVLAAALVAPAFAAQYLLVAPHIRAAASTPIAVTLSNATLPAAQTGAPYATFNFNPLLSVTGDSSFTGAGVVWALESGGLPAGLVLNPDGTLSGTPAGPANTYNFMVSATYKGVSGSGSYSLAVTSASSASFAPGGPDSTGLPSSNVFHDTGVNDYSVQGVVLTNTGSTPLTIQSLGTSGTPFTLTYRGRPPTSSTVAPGSSVTFNAQFRPTAAGLFAGSVAVTTAEAGTFSVSMSGRAVNELPPSLDKTSLDFGNVPANTASSAQVVTVTNVSSVPAQMQAVYLTPTQGNLWNEFSSAGSTCLAGSWYAPGATCTVTVRFTPSVTGSAAYNLSIKTPGGQVVIPLTGNGQ